MQEDIDALIEERGKHYGDPVENHKAIAKIWSGILGEDISAHQVALMMAGLKLRRSSTSPDEPDSLDDAEAYVRISRKCVAERQSWSVI